MFMNSDISDKVERIINQYEDILGLYEERLRRDLKTKTRLDIDWYRLPEMLYLEFIGEANSSAIVMEGLQQWYDYLDGEGFADDFITYMEQTDKSFNDKGNPIYNWYSSQGQGLIYEGKFVEKGKNPSIDDVAFNTLKAAGFSGEGYKGKHGDVGFWLKNTSQKALEQNPKGVSYKAYIDLKYSSDTMQMFKDSRETSTFRYYSDYDLTERILEELRRGIRDSISYHGSNNKINWDTEVNLKGLTAPKILMYIFKDCGLWSSETLDRNKKIIMSNAKAIWKSVRDNRREVSTSRLWYSAPAQGGNSYGNEN